jgi:outer membrane protein OmpA-like peptidoglycan-associated protein
MTTIRSIMAAALFLGLFTQSQILHSQATPKNMFEVGAHGGYFFVTGDVPSQPGWAAGIHIRKATDYLFSLRGDLLYGRAKGDNMLAGDDARDYELKWYSGTLFGVFSLNALRFDKAVRDFNLYAMIGGGGNNFRSEFNNEEERKGTIYFGLSPHASLGAGLSYRINQRINIGLEHQVTTLFGRRADQMDGAELENKIRTPFRDLLQYAHLQININLGNPSNYSEPLYWINPLEGVMDEIADVKKRQDEMLTDSDNDGVIDALDQEPDTPSDAPVDTKGRTLDSDKDGVPDYEDKEPYYPPRAGERVNESGVVINPVVSQGGVSEDRVQEMIDESLSKYGISENNNTVQEWFLPMIHFATEASSVKYSDYGTLASIGRMLKGNAKLKLVVTGHTDQTGSESANDWLSYQRANAVIDHLMTNYGVGRGRLVLQWKGKKDALVPSNSSYMNRRVEFRVAAPDDVEMDPPAGRNKKKSGY